MLQKILIATGDSPESEQVLGAGLKLAEKFGAEILLLHVLNLFQSSFTTISSPYMGAMYPMTNDLDIQQYQKEWKDYEERGRDRLQSYSQQASDRSIKAEIFQNVGDAGRMICETAKNESVNLIVMGRNQKSALSEMFLGSTSNYVLHHAPCSVMVIKPTTL
jgi:nucleotide-binding universal stress UspA family protein